MCGKQDPNKKATEISVERTPGQSSAFALKAEVDTLMCKLRTEEEVKFIKKPQKAIRLFYGWVLTTTEQ